MPKRHEVAINSGYLDFLGGGLGHSLWLSNNRVLESLVQLGLYRGQGRAGGKILNVGNVLYLFKGVVGSFLSSL